MVQDSGQAGAFAELNVTPAMVMAGADRLWELLQAQVGLSYVAEEVFRAMTAKSAMLPRETSRAG